MHPFKYNQVSDVIAASRAVFAEEQAMFIAGGTSLVDLMKLNIEKPTQLIDITSLPLSAIVVREDGSLSIGALARNSDVAHNVDICTRYPVLSQAILAGASGQLRNMATIGGNLMQRVRCPYFRNVSTACNKRIPGSGCSALSGHNREHAILGGSEHCIAPHPSDLCVALVALDAAVQTYGVEGERSIALTDFYSLPEKHPERETVLRRGEVIVAVDVPLQPEGIRSIYIKVRDRTSYAFALVSVAVVMSLQEGVIQHIRIALGGVAPRPWRAYEAEQLLLGQPAHEKNYWRAAAAAMQEAVAQKENAFKIDLARRMITYALMTVGEGI